MTFSKHAHAEIYKYKDASGRWQFSDKKPTESPEKIESLDFKSKSKALTKPELRIEDRAGKYQLLVVNPLYAPVQIIIRGEGIGSLNPGDDLLGGTKERERLSGEFNQVLDANSNRLLAEYPFAPDLARYQFRYVVGAPDIKPVHYDYLVPFGGFKPQRLTQGFHGGFSHFRQPSLYAIDIGMQVGTPIIAVRDGIVISTKDDYSTAGVSSPFFIDKANVVKVLHEDGTYAVYAHLLLGSVKVKPGQKVDAGDVLALSGNTGYSTGPHLHFAIRHNKDGKTHSLPFTFLQKGKLVKPKAGMWLLPVRQ